MASIVWGAAASQWAVKWRSPTSMLSFPTGRRIRGRRRAATANRRPARPTPQRRRSPRTCSTPRPARRQSGVHVTLYKLGEDDRPIRLTQALTDGDGRVRDLLERPLSPGTYRLEFALAVRARRRPRARSASSGAWRSTCGSTTSARSYHVPMLVAPFSMTTYRGLVTGSCHERAPRWRAMEARIVSFPTSHAGVRVAGDRIEVDRLTVHRRPARGVARRPAGG